MKNRVLSQLEGNTISGILLLLAIVAFFLQTIHSVLETSHNQAVMDQQLQVSKDAANSVVLTADELKQADTERSLAVRQVATTLRQSEVERERLLDAQGVALDKMTRLLRIQENRAAETHGRP